jgi:hypothetical protein
VKFHPPAEISAACRDAPTAAVRNIRHGAAKRAGTWTVTVTVTGDSAAYREYYVTFVWTVS